MPHDPTYRQHLTEVRLTEAENKITVALAEGWRRGGMLGKGHGFVGCIDSEALAYGMASITDRTLHRVPEIHRERS